MKIVLSLVALVFTMFVVLNINSTTESTPKIGQRQIECMTERGTTYCLAFVYTEDGWRKMTLKTDNHDPAINKHENWSSELTDL